MKNILSILLLSSLTTFAGGGNLLNPSINGGSGPFNGVWSGNGGGLTNLNLVVGNTWYVDSKNGNDSTGTNNFASKFKNCLPAAMAAYKNFTNSGVRQNIEVFSGVYTGTNNVNLGWTGVDWNFHAGTTLNIFADDTISNSWLPVFSDLNGVADYRVKGSPDISYNFGTNMYNFIHPTNDTRYAPTLIGCTNAFAAVFFSNVLSTPNLELGSVQGFGFNSSGYVGFYGSIANPAPDGTLASYYLISVYNSSNAIINFNSLIDTSFGSSLLYTNPTQTTKSIGQDGVNGVFWGNGDLHMRGTRIGVMAGFGVWAHSCIRNGVGNFYLTCDHDQAPFYTDASPSLGSNSVWRTWSNIGWLDVTTNLANGGSSSFAYGLAFGYNYLTAQKVSSSGMQGCIILNTNGGSGSLAAGFYNTLSLWPQIGKIQSDVQPLTLQNNLLISGTVGDVVSNDVDLGNVIYGGTNGSSLTVLGGISGNGAGLTNLNASSANYNTNPHLPSAVTIGTSPWSFTNATTSMLECYFSGSTAYSVKKNGVSVFASLGSDGYFLLQPTNQCTVTYTGAPTFYTNSLF